MGIFDDIVIVDFPDDPLRQERIMSLETQAVLKNQLAAYKFDLVVDLPICANSHKIILLTGALLTAGFCGSCKILDVSFITYDPTTGCDFVKHSGRTAMVADAIARTVDSGARILRNEALTRETLGLYGMPADAPYIALHSGARIKFTQWPHYTELAERIVRDMDVRVVYFAEDEKQKALLPAELLESGHIIYLSGQMPYDHFDSFLSFASVFVGNDSGPKHLASLRGTQVVSLHSSRTGWDEWGQERGGIVISRKVPCAGCSLHHNYDECAQEVTCIKHITVDEVMGAGQKLYAKSQAAYAGEWPSQVSL